MWGPPPRPACRARGSRPDRGRWCASRAARARWLLPRRARARSWSSYSTRTNVYHLSGGCVTGGPLNKLFWRVMAAFGVRETRFLFFLYYDRDLRSPDTAPAAHTKVHCELAEWRGAHDIAGQVRANADGTRPTRSDRHPTSCPSVVSTAPTRHRGP